jgi:hypothetical protein
VRSFADSGGPDKRSYQVDRSKIVRVLPEFGPRWTVRRGVEQLYEAYPRNGLTFEEFTGTRYPRIKRCASYRKRPAEGELRWRLPLGCPQIGLDIRPTRGSG